LGAKLIEGRSGESLTLLMVGDLILDVPEVESLFSSVAPLLREADVAVGQVEVPFTDRGIASSTDVVAPPCDPKNLSTLAYTGFDAVTLAGNHIWDSGPAGIEDTMEGLRGYGIAATGAGMNIQQAKRPAVVERRGVKFGFLSYNCVGPKESWATEKKPGCAYVRILTHYELDHATPGGPPSIYTFAEPGTLQAMVEDIRELRASCDVAVVGLHKGIGHVPAELAMYEKEVSYAAIDAGADIVMGHHAHILKGIEVYKEKPIFHGLGNFVTVTKALNMENSSGDEDWIARRKKLFDFEPDPEYVNYPFHPEAKYSVIGECRYEDGRISYIGYIPCIIDKQGRPNVVQTREGSEEVCQYVDRITDKARLGTNSSVENTRVRIVY